jgi:flavin-dependent dehydrogenase
LELQGVRAQIEAAGFFRPGQSLIRWSGPEAICKPQPGEPGFQVDRGRFDQILLAAAQAMGVQVLQPAHAARPCWQSHQHWLIPLRGQGGQMVIKTKFLILATGKHCSLVQTKLHQPSTLAIYGYWRETQLQGWESRVEAGTDEWFWGAPLPDGRFNAAVFLDAKRYIATKPQNREQWYRALLAKTTLFNGCLAGYLDAPVEICDASSNLVEDAIGLDWIRVGDAAFAIDPLSSQGVQMAMMSAFQGAIAVHTLLTEPEHAAASIAFYRQKLQETVERSQRTAAQIYATQAAHPVTGFWQQRSQLSLAGSFTSWERNTALFEIDSPIRLSDSAKLIPTPVIQGNSIRFVNALHHPNLETPIAYLGNVAIGSLLDKLVAGQTVVNLMKQWSKQQDQSICWQLLQWFWSHHIIVLNRQAMDEKSSQFESSRI